jgi:hypothetical protein
LSTPTKSIDVAEGHELPSPVPHSRKVAAEDHVGRQDAVVQDRDSLDPTQPLRREVTLGYGAIVAVQALLIGLFGQLVIQYDICKDLRAVHARAAELLRQAIRAAAQADHDLEAAGAMLPVGRSNLLADTYSLPVRRRWSLWKAVAPWATLSVFAALELVTNYLAMLFLRDAAWATWVLAGAATAAVLGGCYFIARSTSTSRSALLGICVAAVVLGSGVMRFRYAVDAVNQGLVDQGQPELGTLTKLSILAFALGLPAAFGVITTAKSRREPTEDGAAARRTEDERLVDGVRRLRMYAERQKSELANAIADESAAADALRNGAAALRGLCDRTEAVITAETGHHVDRLDSYYRGLTMASGDPAITMRVDRRFPAAVGALVEQLTHVVQDARHQLDGIRANLLDFPIRPTQQPERRVEP